jgi:hypothetical protein
VINLFFQGGGYTSLPTSRTFHAGFDRVWGVLVSEISAFAVIKTIDKTSGLITTEALNVGTGLMSEIVLKEYAYRPPNILGTWDAGRAFLSFFANSQGSSTTVRITAHFAGFEANVIHSWIEWPTKGALENVLLDRIAKDIRARSLVRDNDLAIVSEDHVRVDTPLAKDCCDDRFFFHIKGQSNLRSRFVLPSAQSRHPLFRESVGEY